jgi:16S rRNA (cytosine1402-N4)-methyltransferase
LKELNLYGKVNGILADLGYSSMQIDNPLRGFTHKFDGPLDMRMNPLQNLTAAHFLTSVNQSYLCKVLQEHSDEMLAPQIAKRIIDMKPSTTTALADCVKYVYSGKGTNMNDKKSLDSALARTMQAIRIEVNDEFGSLQALLRSIPDALVPGGRSCFLTFHSGEDRRVKKAFKGGFNEGVYESWSRDVVRADEEERRSNPRSKCAKLR